VNRRGFLTSVSALVLLPQAHKPLPFDPEVSERWRQWTLLNRCVTDEIQAIRAFYRKSLGREATDDEVMSWLRLDKNNA